MSFSWTFQGFKPVAFSRPIALSTRSNALRPYIDSAFACNMHQHMALVRRLGVKHFRSIAFGQSHVHSADHSTVEPVNKRGSRRSMLPLHAGQQDVHAAVSHLQIPSANAKLLTNMQAVDKTRITSCVKHNLREKFHASKHSCSSFPKSFIVECKKQRQRQTAWPN